MVHFIMVGIINDKKFSHKVCNDFIFLTLAFDTLLKSNFSMVNSKFQLEAKLEEGKEQTFRPDCLIVWGLWSGSE